MPEARTVTRHMSAGVILVDREGRVLMQLRDDDPAIMFPGHWGLTGGAAQPGETPEQTAAREVREETGLELSKFEPFRAYYFQEQPKGRAGSGRRIEYELYLYHAPCISPLEEMLCGEGRELRFFAPGEVSALDVAYNHRDVLTEFFASPAYGRYVSGEAFEDASVDAVAHFLAALESGEPWFDALMEAIALWEAPAEATTDRHYRYLVGGEAFDWLLLAERLLDAANGRVPDAERERLLFEGAPPDSVTLFDDARLRTMIGETKHRAHLNFIYGVTVEEALQYATELDVVKERVTISMRDKRDGEALRDPVFERVYGATRGELLAQFRAEGKFAVGEALPLETYREFLYWLFKYRVKNSEPARVASDTRRALAQLSAVEAAARRRRSPRHPD